MSAAATNSSRVLEDRSALYNRLLATIPAIERRGAAMPYTSFNGNMFSYLDAEGVLALRLGKEDRQAFIDTYGASLMQSHGAVMKEYVRVPDALFEDTQALAPYLQLSYAYVQTLEAKPTTRKKA